MRRTIKMALITCPECGKEISSQASSCPNCGAPVAKKFCQNCGERIDVDCVVCPHCGKQVGSLKDDKNIIINNNNNNNNNNSASASSSLSARYRSGKKVNKWTAFFLCLFLGWIGAHKFYEGKTGMGILYLCTIGLFGVGWFVDTISILFKPNPYYV
jgi:restriction system protein